MKNQLVRSAYSSEFCNKKIGINLSICTLNFFYVEFVLIFKMAGSLYPIKPNVEVQKHLWVALKILKNALKIVEMFPRCLLLEPMISEQLDVTTGSAPVIAKQLLHQMDPAPSIHIMATGCIHTFKKNRVRDT